MANGRTQTANVGREEAACQMADPARRWGTFNHRDHGDHRDDWVATGPAIHGQEPRISVFSVCFVVKSPGRAGRETLYRRVRSERRDTCGKSNSQHNNLCALGGLCGESLGVLCALCGKPRMGQASSRLGVEPLLRREGSGPADVFFVPGDQWRAAALRRRRIEGVPASQ
jgi:hypothetical protein